jgi:hypothetical protein
MVQTVRQRSRLSAFTARLRGRVTLGRCVRRQDRGIERRQPLHDGTGVASRHGPALPDRAWNDQHDSDNPGARHSAWLYHGSPNNTAS